MKRFASLLGLFALGGCGGGGGGGNSGPGPVTGPAALPVTLSAPSGSVIVLDGAKPDFGFTATYTGTPSGAVVADIRVSDPRVVVDGTPTASGASYTVKLRPTEFLPTGQVTTQVTFRLCVDAGCAAVYPGSTQAFAATFNFKLKDWATFQRDPAHTGYVAVKYNPSAFAAAWNVPRDAGRLSAVAAREGSVFANFAQADGRLITKAFAADTGALRWLADLGRSNYFSAPTYGNGRVISAAMDSSSSTLPMQVLDASSGRALRVLNYASQFATAGAPVPFGDKLYHQAGYYGNVVYGYDAAAGAKDWESASSLLGGVSEGESVAVDDQNVYFYRADALLILSRATGALVKRIPDPFFSKAGLSYFGFYYGAPILDGAGRIFAFSDNRGVNQPSALIAFAATQDAYVWRSSATYVGMPALRAGRLYAPRANSTFVDVLDTADGRVITSINVGTGKPNLTSNVIVTENLIFVASGSETYAIDHTQTGNPVVWSVARGGDLAISPDNLLVISGTNGVSAYKLL